MDDKFLIALQGLSPEQYYEWSLVTSLLDDGYNSDEIKTIIYSSKLTDMVINPDTRWTVMHDMGHEEWKSIVLRDYDRLNK